MKRFSDLTEQEVLALAITNEEEDSRIYRGFAEGLREKFPSSAKVFDEMAEEVVLRFEVLVEGAFGAAGARDDVVDARGVDAALRELRLGRGGARSTARRR